MKKIILWTLIFSIFGFSLNSGADENQTIKMSTTTSTEASGLLDIILPEFENDTGIKIKVLAKGTGAAIKDGMDGNVDIIFVHAKEREHKFVAEGYGTKRYAVMHNDFIIIGPGDDPAGIRGLNDAALALNKIAVSKSKFISRGDDSGTHTKEQFLWTLSGIKLISQSKQIIKKGNPYILSYKHPENAEKWYLSIGQGMGKALIFANEKQAYAMTDRGTYLKFKFDQRIGLQLDILCEGDSRLANPYGLIPVSPDKFPHVKYSLAKKFAEWMISKKGQTLIENYRLNGMQLFFPDALPSKLN
jgi:tungstate transport system substrate-binding protein